ncbi:MAG: peptide ABC transporter substrate-binding protein [Lactobacillus sp.]|jgi:ABC-type oligopeptide transport system substrate-binding subunit|nr:peptide ABC transporter substrate-binding protein [Lactobacillus sp.]
MKQHKAIILALFSTAAILLLAACGQTSTSNSKDSGTQLAAKQMATIVSTKEITSLDPTNVIDATSTQILQNVYEGLYRLDQHNQPVVAGAKALPTISPDGLTYTIDLRQDAKWSNGDPVTAEDYVYAWQRGVSQKNAAQNLAQYQSVKNAKAIIQDHQDPTTLGVKALSKYQLQIQLAQPTTYFTKLLTTISFFPVNHTYASNIGKNYGATSSKAVYNGPYRLTGFRGSGTSEDWTLVKNKSYWQQKTVKMQQLKFKLIKEAATGAELFEAKKVDQTPITGQITKNYQNNVAYHSAASSSSVYLGYNFNQELFKNAKVRQAIALVLDRQALAKHTLQDGSTAATGLIPKGIFSDAQGNDFATAAGNLTATDTKKATRLWEEAKSELNLKGTTEFDLLTFENEDERLATQYIQGQIQKYLPGLKANIKVQPVSVFMKNTTAGNFGMYLVSWGSDYPDAGSQLSLFTSDSGNNWGHYSSTKYDALLNQANAQTDAAKRWSDQQAAQKVLLSDYGISPVFFTRVSYLQNPKLKGVTLNTQEGSFNYQKAYLVK